MHDSFNYQLLSKPKTKKPTKPAPTPELSRNPSINFSTSAPVTSPTVTDMAFSHSFQPYLPSTLQPDPQLPERLKPKEPSILNPKTEEDDIFLDLVVLAEFSEQEGPRPLIILDEGYDASVFDANSFAVRIMSVDASAPPTINSSSSFREGVNAEDDKHPHYHSHEASFRLAQDSVVIHLETGDDRVVSHVRHFTLYDLEARGFVRPFCVSYVTRNSDKLVRRHDLIDAKFNEAAAAFKRGNYLQFSRELQKRLIDLGYTKGRMIEWNQGQLSTIPPEVRLEPVPHLHRPSSVHSTTSSQYNSIPFAFTEGALGTSPESAFETPSCCSRDERDDHGSKTVEDKSQEERHNQEFETFFNEIGKSEANDANCGEDVENETANKDEKDVTIYVTAQAASITIESDGSSSESEGEPSSSIDAGSSIQTNDINHPEEDTADASHMKRLAASDAESGRCTTNADNLPRYSDKDSGIDNSPHLVVTQVPHGHRDASITDEKPIKADNAIPKSHPFDEDTIDILRMTTVSQIDEAIQETRSIKGMIENQLNAQRQQAEPQPANSFLRHEKKSKTTSDSSRRKISIERTPREAIALDSATIASSTSSTSSSSSSSLCCQVGDEWYSPKVVPPVTQRLFDKDLTPLRDLTTAAYKDGMEALKELKAAIAEDAADEWTMEEEEEEERKRSVKEVRKEGGLSEAKRRSVTRVFEAGYGYEREAKDNDRRGREIAEEFDEESEVERSVGEAGINWSHF